MKYYIVSEEELKDLVKVVFHSEHPIQTLYDWIAIFKSKTPVEEIFCGEYSINVEEGTFENPDFWEAMEKIIDVGKVRIYIEVIK